jgi:Uncharacterized membrane protein
MRKKMLWAFVIVTVIVLLLIILANVVIVSKTRSYVYDEVAEIPSAKVGLVLGTSKYLSNGNINYYFKYRIDAAAELYKEGKVKYLVVSGDNHKKGYNEPQLMKNDLIAAGVPAKAIYADYAGFRTLDSVVRMREIFGQEEFIIVSQRFHNERAVYIAWHYGLKVYGYNARDVKHYSGLKTQLREKFARVKVFIDFITHKQPKYLGETIEIK